MVLHRNLGDVDTTAIGLGEMPLTIENNLGEEIGIETIHAALDAGCRHVDTARGVRNRLARNWSTAPSHRGVAHATRCS